MKGLQTLIKLPSVERRLVLRTLLLVTAIRIGLWIISFQRLQRLTASWRRLPFAVSADIPVGRLVWAVRAASRRIPAASCLTQSLALHCLLSRAGHNSYIRIGAAKDSEAGFTAHAWVEFEGQPLLSAPEEVARYVRMLAMEDRLA